MAHIRANHIHKSMQYTSEQHREGKRLFSSKITFIRYIKTEQVIDVYSLVSNRHLPCILTLENCPIPPPLPECSSDLSLINFLQRESKSAPLRRRNLGLTQMYTSYEDPVLYIGVLSRCLCESINPSYRSRIDTAGCSLLLKPSLSLILRSKIVAPNF